MKLETLKEAWESYARDVLPMMASTVQRQETRRAFYAGAQAMMAVAKVIGTDAVSEADGVLAFEACDQELMEFNLAVKAGRM
jgi:hypothetical protein